MSEKIWDEKPKGFTATAIPDNRLYHAGNMDAWLEKLMKQQLEDKQIFIDRINELEEKLEVVMKHAETLQGYKVQLLPDEEVEEEITKEPEIIHCSCGETFDWEHWDRETWPMPKGMHEAVRHLDMGHKLMSPKIWRERNEP